MEFSASGLATAGFCLFAAAFAAPGLAQVGDPLVLIQRTIDTRYGDNPVADQHFRTAIDSPVERLVDIKPGDNLQQLTTRVFGIGPTTAPDQYEAMKQSIQQKNNLADVDLIIAGTKLKIPDLPPKLYRKTDVEIPFYDQPRISGSARLEAVKRGTAFDFDRMATTAIGGLTDVSRKVAPKVIQWRWVPASVARKEIADSGGPLNVKAASGPMEIHFADAQSDHPPPALSADLIFLQGFLAKRHPTHPSVLLVLDDSWPSQEDFVHTRDFLKKAVDVVRTRFYLGKPEWAGGAVADEAQTDFPFLHDGRTSHAAEIAASLANFTKLSSDVKVIYIPLFVEQKWAKEFWHEIILVDQTASNKGEGLETPYMPIDDVMDIARKNTDDLMRGIPTHMTNSVSRIDQATLNGLLQFAHLYSRATGSPFFLSMSWWVVSHTMDLTLDPDSLGVPLAAAGNETTEDIMATKRLLAYHAKKAPGDVVAVMNPNRDGTITCTSVWNVPGDQVFYGLAYDGILDAKTCGTSFSTPRVGWLLALREGFNAPVKDADVGRWYGNYQDFLQGLQDPAATGYMRYWLSPQRLFTGVP